MLGFARPAAADHWMAERAAGSDLVVLAKLDRTDYRYSRDIAVGGRAWFRPLIGYKTDPEQAGLLVVAERGLKENACYFPRTMPWDETPRYLLFLESDGDGALRGHPDGCAVEILVDSTGRYAARWPQPAFGGEHGRGDAVLQAQVREMTFQGPFARIDASDLLDHQRKARAERDFMEIDGTDLVPTRGIPLGELRALMRPGLDLRAEAGIERDAARNRRKL